MKVHDTESIASAAISAQPGRPASALMHDSADARVVLFRIDPGQEVAVHTSTSSVLLSIVSGEGTVSGSDGEKVVRAGDFVTYAPGEPHGMRAGATRFVIAAVIAPRPGK